jgi:UDP-glucose 4-epimerase
MILIVGGAGYIGSHTNKLLNRSGYRTVIFDNLRSGHREFVKWGAFVRGDLADKDQIRRCFQTHPIEAVMHFSALACVGESVAQPGLYYQNNVVNTINLLEVMREFDVAQFIFSSSAATYGMPQQIPIPEDHPLQPINPYGRTKVMVEQILADYDHAFGVRHVNLRYFNAAGADPDGELGERHEPETHLIPIVMAAALGMRDSVSLFGTDYPTRDGTCIRDYIHVNDLAQAHLQALEYLRAQNRSASFNLGNATGYSVREVMEKVREISKRDFKVVEVPRRPGDPAILVSSSQKARDLLGWQPQFADLEVIIRTAWDWHCAESMKPGLVADKAEAIV